MAREIEVCDLYRDVKVFKVSHIVGGINDIANIYVFCGSDHAKMNGFFADTFKPMFISDAAADDDAAAVSSKKELAPTDPNVKAMLPFFSMMELENITSHNISVTFLNERIHLDDSIEIIKRKVMRALQTHQPLISISELYLFGKQCLSQLTTRMAYDALSRAGKDVITKVKLDNFVSNIDKINTSSVELAVAEDCNHKYNGQRAARPKFKSDSDSGSGSGSGSSAESGSGSDDDDNAESSGGEHDEDPYTFEDIRDLNLERKMQVVSTCIGHAFVEDGLAHVFAADPFVNATSYDQQTLDVRATSTDSQLLMDCELFLFNTLFVCCAADVLEFSSSVRHKNDTDGSKALKIYFPALAKQMRKSSCAISIETYVENAAFKQTLADIARADLADEAFTRNCANVNFFYEVYDNRDTSVTNPSGGAESFAYADQGIRRLSVVIAPENAGAFPIDAVFKTVCTSNELLFMKLNYARRDNVYKFHSPHTNRYGNKVPVLKMSEFTHINALCGMPNCVSLYFSRFAPSKSTSATAATATRFCDHVICEFDTLGRIFVSVVLHRLCNVGMVDEIIRSVLNPIINKLNHAFQQNGVFIAQYASAYDTRNVRVLDMEYEMSARTDRQIIMGEIFSCSESIFTKPEFYNKNKNVTVMNLKRVSDFDEQHFSDIAAAASHDTNDGSGGNGKRDRGIRIFINGDTDKLTKTSNMTISIERVNNIYYLCTIPIYIDALLRIFHNERTKIPLDRIQKMCFKAAPPISEMPDTGPGPAVAGPAVAVEETVEKEKEVPKPKSAFFLGDMFGDNDANTGSDSDSNSDSDSSRSSGGSKPEKNRPGSGGAKALASAKAPRAQKVPKSVASATAAAAAASKHDDLADVQKKNPFLDRLQKADKVLFFISKNPKEKGYARCCQKRSKAHNHSQPVALTDAEMVELDPEFATNKKYELHRDDMSKTSFYRYSEMIESVEGKPPVLVVNAYRFGSTEQTARWYICPRFWNLETNTFVSERDAIARYYNKSTRKFDLPKGIYEFESGVEPYVKLYPGFVEQMHDHKLVRMPCCFTTALNNIRYTSAEEKADVAAKKMADKLAKMPDAERRAALEAAGATAPTAVTVPEWKAQAMATGLIPTLDKLNDEKVKTTTTIFDANKRSLKSHQLGHLPVPIQKFFFSNSGNEDCSAIGRECLLRRGVEKGKRDTQSIIGAIAYIYAEYVTIKTKEGQTIQPRSVKEMRRTILDAITLDSFITYQNGSLVTQFQSGVDLDDAAAYDTPAVGSEYAGSLIYAQLMKSAAADTSSKSAEQKKLQLHKICIAFDKFKKFFDDDDAVLDSAMLWDIVTEPNPKLFAEGNNMIVLELPDNDDTHNVRIVCPSNHYSGRFFDRRKPTFFLIKKYGLYEPICFHRVNRNGSTAVTYRFNLSELGDPKQSNQPKLFLNVKYAIEFAKRVQNKYCAPPDGSHPKSRYYKPNHPAKYVERVLKHYGYAITAQVLNYDNRVIGFMVQKQPPPTGNGNGDGTAAAAAAAALLLRGYIPTESSEILMDFNSLVAAEVGVGVGAQPRQIPKYDMVYTDDPSIAWNGFTATVSFLKYVNMDTKRKISCLPRVKVLDDTGRMVIGLITETNQFIRSRPEENRADEYDDDGHIASASAIGVKGDHFLMDKIVMLNQAQASFNPIKQKFIRDVQLDSNFYHAFRITARVVLNQYLASDMRKHRAAIESAISSASMPYSEKMRVVDDRLRRLLKAHVAFDSEYDTSAISEVFSCITNEACKQKTAESGEAGEAGEAGGVPVYCTYDTGSKTCRLNIPKYKISSDAATASSSTRVENERIYYARLADELVRHERSRLFLLKANAYLFTSRVKYGICESELVVMQSDIDNKFFSQAKNMPDAIERGSALKPNTSFFNAKRSDKTPPMYDASFMRAVRPAREYDSHSDSDSSSSSSSSSEGEGEGPLQLQALEGVPRIVNKPVSAQVSQRLADPPSKFTMDVFEGVFPTTTTTTTTTQTQPRAKKGGSSGDAIKETVNGSITFAIMANILHLENRIDSNEDVNKIKAVLCDRYAELKNFGFSGVTSPLNKICKIFKHFGMAENADAVLKKLYSDELLIRSSRYVLTPFDIWLLAEFYKVPIIIMSDAANGDGDSSFHSRFFGTGGRTLYADADADALASSSSSYVIVSLRPLREFPVYGILSYSESEQSGGPVHAIPLSALKQIDEPDYPTPVEFLNNGLYEQRPAAAKPDQANADTDDENYPDITSSHLYRRPGTPPAVPPPPPPPPPPPHPTLPVPAAPVAPAAPAAPVAPVSVSKQSKQPKRQPVVNRDTNQLILDALTELRSVTKQTDDIIESRTVSDLQTKLDQISTKSKKTTSTADTGA